MKPSIFLTQLPTYSKKQVFVRNLTVFRQILAPTEDQPIGY